MSMLGPYVSIFENFGLTKTCGTQPRVVSYQGKEQNVNGVVCSYVNRDALKGVIHVGACDCVESGCYEQLFGDNVFYIEANKKLYDEWVKPSCDYYGWPSCNVACGREEGRGKLYDIGNPQCGSLHSFDPNRPYQEVDVKPLSLVVEENGIDLNNYNFLNIDVEGAELEVLEGAESIIDSFDFVDLEVSVAKRYGEEDCLFEDTKKWLEDKGFEMYTVSDSIKQHNWGDAFFVRKSLNLIKL